MGAFLYAEGFKIIKAFMKRFIKKDVMEEDETAKQPSQIDVSSKKFSLNHQM